MNSSPRCFLCCVKSFSLLNFTKLYTTLQKLHQILPIFSQVYLTLLNFTQLANLFSWLEFILVSCVNIVISWKTPHKSKKDKKFIYLSNDIPSKKITPLSLFQLLKLKKICLYFLDQTSFEGDMSFLTFCDRWFDNGHMDIYFVITKSIYLSNMMSEQKNMGTLFSSILKVKEIKVYLFPWSEFLVVSYCNFVVSWT